jgi:hypothetical protein
MTVAKPSSNRSHHRGGRQPRFDYDLRLVAPEWEATASTPEELKEQEEDFKWGVITGWENAPDGSQLPIMARIDRWRIELLIELAPGTPFRTAAWSAIDEIDDWWELFRSWLEIVTTHNVSKRRTRGGIRSEPIWIWDSSDFATRRNAGIARSGPIYDQPGPPIDRATLEACMRLAADGQPPPDMWLFIRDARALLDSGDYRRAVIDAGVPQTPAGAIKALAVATNLVEQAEPSLGLIPHGDTF